MTINRNRVKISETLPKHQLGNGMQWILIQIQPLLIWAYLSKCLAYLEVPSKRSFRSTSEATCSLFILLTNQKRPSSMLRRCIKCQTNHTNLQTTNNPTKNNRKATKASTQTYISTLEHVFWKQPSPPPRQTKKHKLNQTPPKDYTKTKKAPGTTQTNKSTWVTSPSPTKPRCSVLPIHRLILVADALLRAAVEPPEGYFWVCHMRSYL